MRLGVSLATVGVAVSVLVMAVFCHYVLGLSWELAVLLGAVTSPTDAAAVFSVLRRVPLPRRLTGALEAESGLNDAPVVVLVTLVSVGGNHSVWGFAGEIVWELGLGVAGGLAVGFGGAWLLRRSALPSSGLYPLAVLSLHRVRLRRHRGPARLRLRCGVRRCADPGQRRAPAPCGHAIVLGGGRLAGADRAVRDARPAALAGPDRRRGDRHRDRGRLRAHRAGPADLGLRVLAGATDAPARAGLPVVGGPAWCGADRAGDDPAGRGRPRCPAAVRPSSSCSSSSTPWSPPRRCRGSRRCSRSRGAASLGTSRSRQHRSIGSRPTCCR